jgi:TetR/AcrR family transcriptional regulator, multidrug resistance operon repressor
MTQTELNKRSKILNTMLKLVVRQGIQATPMSQVVKESGVAAGTIYHHFSSKEEIINELYLNLKQEFGKALTENINPDLDYKSLFFQTWRNLYDYFYENETAFHFAEQIGHCTMITPETKQKGEVYYLPILQFFAAGIAQDHLRDMDLKLMSNLIYGNVVTAVQLSLSGELIMTNERLEAVIQSSWDSVSKH